MCGFLENGVLFPSGIIVTETKDIGVLTIGPCSAVGAVVVVVGGGGTSTLDAGSGSGYVEFKELQFPRPYSNLGATVGSAGQQSILTDGNSEVLVTALPGGDGGSYQGADGYSGGGADGYNGLVGGDGGSDGGDGSDSEYYSGGKGSGLDIRTLPITNFELR